MKSAWRGSLMPGIETERKDDCGLQRVYEGDQSIHTG
jgi:hypothetical protein